MRCGGEGLVEDGGSNSEGEGKVSVLHTHNQHCCINVHLQYPSSLHRRELKGIYTSFYIVQHMYTLDACD